VTVRELIERLKDADQELEVVVDTEARCFDVHWVDIEYVEAVGHPPRVVLSLDTHNSHFEHGGGRVE
jgi:hypothetical protein